MRIKFMQESEVYSLVIAEISLAYSFDMYCAVEFSHPIDSDFLTGKGISLWSQMSDTCQNQLV